MRPGAARRSPLSHGGGGLAIPAAGRRAARTASTSVAALPLAGGRAPTRMNAGRLRGGPRFDAWCRTDPATLTQRQADPRAQRAITARWAADPDHRHPNPDQPDPDRRRHRAGRQPRHRQLPLLLPLVVDPPGTPTGTPRRAAAVSRATVRLRRLRGKLAGGGAFVRRILTGPFHTTTDIDACNPTEAGGHHGLPD